MIAVRPLQATISAHRDRDCSALPGQPDVKAAWHALPAEVRDRIGIIATDMVFQAFVSFDAFGPEDQPVPGDDDPAHAIRGEAGEATCRRLTELHNVVEDALPVLFGTAGQNPDWAVAMGAKR